MFTKDQIQQLKELLEPMNKKLDEVVQAQDQTQTALEAVRAGLEDVQAKQKEQPTKQDVETTVDAAKAELKGDIYTLEGKLIKKIQRHERRISNIEESEDIENPDKN